MSTLAAPHNPNASPARNGHTADDPCDEPFAHSRPLRRLSTNRQGWTHRTMALPRYRPYLGAPIGPMDSEGGLQSSRGAVAEKGTQPALTSLRNTNTNDDMLV